MRWFWICAFLPACSLVVDVHEGDGVAATEERAVAAFTGVRAPGQVDVRVTIGEPLRVSVTCDQNLVGDVSTEVEGDALVVRFRGDARPSFDRFRPHTACRADVTMPSLEAIDLTGSGNIDVDGEQATALAAVTLTGSGSVTVVAPVDVALLSIDDDGSGDVAVDDVTCDEVDVRTSGSGDVRVAGVTDVLHLMNTGSGATALGELDASTVDVVLSGSGDAEVSASAAVQGRVSGSGDLVVRGDPAERDVARSGSGDVTFAP